MDGVIGRWLGTTGLGTGQVLCDADGGLHPEPGHHLEVWDGNVLLSGGKHYGHLEIDVIMNAAGQWDVTLTPAYAFPILSPTDPGVILGWERRTYDDVVRFTAVPEPGTAVLVLTGIAAGWALRRGRRPDARRHSRPA